MGKVPYKKHALSVALGGVLFCASSVAAASAWYPVSNDDGITITAREQTRESLPAFRGVAIFDAPLLQIAAVIWDVNSHCKWMHRCTEAEVLGRPHPEVVIAYNRSDSPWPVTDRDVVYRAWMNFNLSQGEVWSHFVNDNHDAAKTPDDTVRMPKLEGYYRLERLGPKRTRVTYQVAADAGGAIPMWVMRSVSKRIPLFTLKNLRMRVRRMGTTYARQVATWRARYNNSSDPVLAEHLVAGALGD